MRRSCWASSRGPFGFDQMSVHPPVPAFADIAHNAIHDDCINVAADRRLPPDGTSCGLEHFSFFTIATPNLSFSLGLVGSGIYESEYGTRGHCCSRGWGSKKSHGLRCYLEYHPGARTRPPISALCPAPLPGRPRAAEFDRAFVETEIAEADQETGPHLPSDRIFCITS
jgi:hypothetical protein